MQLTKFIEKFDATLHDYLDKKIAQTQQILGDKNFYVAYTKEITQKGKRIRPYNVQLTFSGYGTGITSDISSFLLAFELLHTFALIHDDWIDHAQMRRSVPTSHVYYKEKINDAHIAASQAILVGDLCFAWAYETLEESLDGVDHKAHAAARKHFHTMAQEVVWGQMLDVDFMLGMPVNMDEITTKSYYKTASYTFVRPLLAGAALAGVTDEEELAKVHNIGKYMGIAFQMRDDLLDMYKPHNDKSIFNDIQEGQQTLFTQYVFDRGTTQQQTTLRTKMGQPLTQDDKDELTALFTQIGAFTYGITTTNEYLDKALQVLSTMNITQQAKAEFEEIIQFLQVS